MPIFGVETQAVKGKEETPAYLQALQQRTTLDWSKFIDQFEILGSNKIDNLVYNSYQLFPIVEKLLQNQKLDKKEKEIVAFIVQLFNQDPKHTDFYWPETKEGQLLMILSHYLQLNQSQQSYFVKRFQEHQVFNFWLKSVDNHQELVRLLNEEMPSYGFEFAPNPPPKEALKSKQLEFKQNLALWRAGIRKKLVAALQNNPQVIEIILNLIRKDKVLSRAYLRKNSQGTLYLSDLIKSAEVETTPPFLTELTQARNRNQADIYPREKELKQILKILISPSQNHNPLLVGESGVGKTSLVESLAQELEKVQAESKPEKTIKIFQLDVDKLLSSKNHRAYPFEANWSNLIAFLTDLPKDTIYILFIDELQSLIDKTRETKEDFTNRLKVLLNNPQIRLVGAMTDIEFGSIRATDPAIIRRFSEIRMGQPDKKTILNIIRNRLKSYFDFSFANTQAEDRFFNLVSRNTALFGGINFLDNAIKTADFLLQAYREEKNSWYDGTINEKELLDLINKHRLDISQNFAGENFAQFAKKSLKGQDHVFKELDQLFDLFQTQLNDIRKPIATALLTGKTGVGKSETAKQLARWFYQLSHPENKDEPNPEELPLAEIDCATLNMEFGVSFLTGSPPGYVGHDETPEWVRKIDQVGKSGPVVILLDEIEKAHPSVLKSLFRMLDEGSYTLANGRSITFRNAVILASSNIITQPVAEKELRQILAKKFKDEAFINRFECVIQYKPLSEEVITEIIESKELQNLFDKLFERLKIDVRWIDSKLIKNFVQRYLEEEGQADFGARDITRHFNQNIALPIAQTIKERAIIDRTDLEESIFIIKSQSDEQGRQKPQLIEIKKDFLIKLKNNIGHILHRLHQQTGVKTIVLKKFADDFLTSLVTNLTENNLDKQRYILTFYQKVEQEIKTAINLAIEANQNKKIQELILYCSNDGKILALTAEEMRATAQNA